MGPKNPLAHASHDEPVNPGAHLQVPEDKQMPEPAHGGEQAEDCMSSKERDPESPDGSWFTSGIESQMITRLFEDPEFAAIQMLDDIASDLAVSGVDVLIIGVEGRGVKLDCPA